MMPAGLGWPDLLILAVVLLGAFKGFKRGFVAELSGAIALTAAIVGAFLYGGQWDAWFVTMTHLGPGSAHVVAMFAFALLCYAVVAALGIALGTVAKLPLIGIANSLLGACVGVAKAALLLWAVLYIALFFPLSRDLRADLHHSPLVAALVAPNDRFDGMIRKALPGFVRPFSGFLFERHRV
ncbi:MAG: CvpA family protein [Candidatus Baltobacteraceae bacterium]